MRLYSLDLVNLSVLLLGFSVGLICEVAHGGRVTLPGSGLRMCRQKILNLTSMIFCAIFLVWGRGSDQANNRRSSKSSTADPASADFNRLGRGCLVKLIAYVYSLFLPATAFAEGLSIPQYVDYDPNVSIGIFYEGSAGLPRGRPGSVMVPNGLSEFAPVLHGGFGPYMNAGIDPSSISHHGFASTEIRPGTNLPPLSVTATHGSAYDNGYLPGTFASLDEFYRLQAQQIHDLADRFGLSPGEVPHVLMSCNAGNRGSIVQLTEGISNALGEPANVFLPTSPGGVSIESDFDSAYNMMNASDSDRILAGRNVPGAVPRCPSKPPKLKCGTSIEPFEVATRVLGEEKVEEYYGGLPSWVRYAIELPGRAIDLGDDIVEPYIGFPAVSAVGTVTEFLMEPIYQQLEGPRPIPFGQEWNPIYNPNAI